MNTYTKNVIHFTLVAIKVSEETDFWETVEQQIKIYPELVHEAFDLLTTFEGYNFNDYEYDTNEMKEAYNDYVMLLVPLS